MKEGNYYFINKKKIYIIWMIFLAWSFVGERFFFDFTYFSERYQLYFIAKLCYAIMIWFFIKYSLKLISKIINNKKKYIAIILPSILVIIFYVIIFLCLYPGIWIGDEYFVLGEASRFSYCYNQGVIITIINMIEMMFIPIPSFTVVVQIIMMGIAAAFSLKIILVWSNYSKWSYCILIIYLLPPTIYHVMFPHRSSLVAILEYIMLLDVLNQYVERKSIFKEERENWIIRGIVYAIIPMLRKETILISIGYMVSLFFINKRENKNSLIKVAAIMLGIIGSVSIYEKINMTQIDSYSGNAYMCLTLPNLLTENSVGGGVKLEDNLKNINKIIDINKLKEHRTSYAASEAYFTSLRDRYTKEEFENAKKAFWNIVLSNWKEFLSIRNKVFLVTNSLDENEKPIPWWGIGGATQEHTEHMKEMLGLNNKLLFSPISYSVRQNTWNKLLCISKTGKQNSLYRIIWNVIPSLIVIVIIGIYAIFTKKMRWLMFLMGSYAALTAGIFLLCSEASLFYYMAVYWTGLFFWCLILIKGLANLKNSI